jgi:hypothetical protein
LRSHLFHALACSLLVAGCGGRVQDASIDDVGSGGRSASSGGTNSGGLVILGSCPSNTPVAASACTGEMTCVYTRPRACCDHVTTAECEEGIWRLTDLDCSCPDPAGGTGGALAASASGGVPEGGSVGVGAGTAGSSGTGTSGGGGIAGGLVVAPPPSGAAGACGVDELTVECAAGSECRYLASQLILIDGRVCICTDEYRWSCSSW